VLSPLLVDIHVGVYVDLLYFSNVTCNKLYILTDVNPDGWGPPPHTKELSSKVVDTIRPAWNICFYSKTSVKVDADLGSRGAKLRLEALLGFRISA
jgi:hypothetical protein